MLHNHSRAQDDVPRLLDAQAQVRGFERWCVIWHEDESVAAPDATLSRLHRANFDLWHLEDRARDPRSSDAEIAAVKRRIDVTNQQRNDAVEQIDVELLAVLAAHGLPDVSAPLHSETVGQMLDRLSILSLKLFHTEEETRRGDGPALHVQRNRERLAVLRRQSEDLTACLELLWQEVCRGERQFKIYRQMKMYNDPELNPVLYRQSPAG